MSHLRAFLCLSLFVISSFSISQSNAAQNDILFVAQVCPVKDDDEHLNVLSTFGNHLGNVDMAPRGGGLYIKYASGTLRDLTAAAGFGIDGTDITPFTPTFPESYRLQDPDTSIAVRDPALSFDGTKIIFSMVQGTTVDINDDRKFFWQIYEMTNFGEAQTPVITKVANQPANVNNVMPSYLSDGRILFVSDRMPTGKEHLYPLRDEYEALETNTGLWTLNPADGALEHIDNAPSGVFNPSVDSFGRIVYTRWDHLIRDQFNVPGLNGARNFSSEDVGATEGAAAEFFPEAVSEDTRPSARENAQYFNNFFPWQINQDGSDHETLNHIGRHEMHGTFPKNFTDDPAVVDFNSAQVVRTNQTLAETFFQVRESLVTPGRYFGVNSAEFNTHASGQLLSMIAPPTQNANNIVITALTDRLSATPSNDPAHPGLFRNPLELASGLLIASHSNARAGSEGVYINIFGPAAKSVNNPFNLRLVNLVQQGNFFVPGEDVVGIMFRRLAWFSPRENSLIASGYQLCQVQPVEILPRAVPPAPTANLPQPEKNVLAEERQSLPALENFLKANNLALLVSRNLTTRDANDKQQPFNLKVAGTATQTKVGTGKVYDISHLQIFQGDMIRGYIDNGSTLEGRRTVAVPLHDISASNIAGQSIAQGSFKIGTDGSFAALVPARRALTWQLIAPDASPVVRERFWLTFQPGEIRVCTSCHGINATDQAGRAAPQNEPEALRQLIRSINGLPVDPAPKYSLRILDSRKKKSLSRLHAKEKFILQAKASNNDSALRDLSVKMKIGSSSCTEFSKAFTSKEAGTFELAFTTPDIRTRQKLEFQILFRGRVVAKKTIEITNSRSGNLSKSQVSSFCKSFGKFSVK